MFILNKAVDFFDIWITEKSLPDSCFMDFDAVDHLYIMSTVNTENSNLSLRRAFFQIFDFKECCDLEIRVRGHSRSLKVVPFDRLLMLSY